MNISCRRSCAGVSYLAVLVPVFLLGTLVVAYLRLVSVQNYASVRSQSWNLSLIIAESGVEEALAHLNLSGTNLAGSGWTKSGTLYSKRSYLSTNDYYEVSINMSNPANPVITSQGYVPAVVNNVR